MSVQAFFDGKEPCPARLEVDTACEALCVPQLEDYKGCVARYEAAPTGANNCAPQYDDFWHCVDHCVRVGSHPARFTHRFPRRRHPRSSPSSSKRRAC